MASDAYYRTIRWIESRNNDGATSSTGAAGPFQFTKGTARDYGLSLADRYDYAKSYAAVTRLTDDNFTTLARGLGRDPTEGELYLAHQQGAGGALKLLGNPDGLASGSVGLQAILVNGGRASMTNGEFASLWTSKYAKEKAGLGLGSTGTAAQGSPVMTKDGYPQRGAGGEVVTTDWSQAVPEAIDRERMQQKEDEKAGRETSEKISKAGIASDTAIAEYTDTSFSGLLQRAGIVLVGGLILTAGMIWLIKNAPGAEAIPGVAVAKRVGRAL